MIESTRKWCYSDLRDLNQRMIQPLNQAFGGDAFKFEWKRNKFIYIFCKAKGCCFSIWFAFEFLDSKSKLPVSIRLHREANLNHLLSKHTHEAL